MILNRYGKPKNVNKIEFVVKFSTRTCNFFNMSIESSFVIFRPCVEEK